MIFVYWDGEGKGWGVGLGRTKREQRGKKADKEMEKTYIYSFNTYCPEAMGEGN